MKKILLGLFSILSISAMAAEGINIYGRVGLDIYSHYNGISYRDVKAPDPEYASYRFRATAPPNPEINSSVKSRGKLAPSIALEITKDLGSNFELGLGIAYVWHGKRDYKETGIDYDGGRYYADGKMPAINSIPLYVTGKYKFNTNSDVKPYIKADLGYSFNRMKKSFNVSGNYENGDVYTHKYEGLKAKNGLYTAIGLGMEYKNVTVDLSYVFTAAKVKMQVIDFDNNNNGIENRTFKANNSAVRLTVGYKFSF